MVHYILGPDDRLRKYPFAEMRHWDDQNDPQKFRRSHYRPRFGEEIDIPQAVPANEPAPGTRQTVGAPDKAPGSPQTQAGMLFDRMMDAAARGDSDGMRGISQQYAQTDTAQQWLQQGRDANQAIAEERERQQVQDRLAAQEREQGNRAVAPAMVMG